MKEEKQEQQRETEEKLKKAGAKGNKTTRRERASVRVKENKTIGGKKRIG